MDEMLKSVLRQNREKYIAYLKDLVAIDTQVIGHGIDGGREKMDNFFLKKFCQRWVLR